jgi:polyferredoxin
MAKMNYAPGLISYTTENKLAGRGRTWKRPKLVGYGLAVILMITLFSYSLFTRMPLELDIMRNRGELYHEVADGLIRNTYLVKIINMDRKTHTYQLALSGLPAPRMVPDARIVAPAGEVVELSIDVLVDPDKLIEVNTEIEFRVETDDSLWYATSESRYLGPEPIRSQNND